MHFASKWILDLGPVLPFDQTFAGYDPSAHVLDDFFENKMAFTVLLNFPLTTLDARLKDGPAGAVVNGPKPGWRKVFQACSGTGEFGHQRG